MAVSNLGSTKVAYLNTSAETYGVVRKWLLSLGTLCAGSMPVEEARMRVAAYASMLSEQFGPHAFTQGSLEKVARESKFFPSYAEVAERLSAWQRENPPPRHTALAAPAAGDFSGWTASDHSWLESWRAQRAAGFPPVKDPCPRQPDIESNNPIDHRRAQWAKLIRQMSPRAWAHIEEGRA